MRSFAPVLAAVLFLLAGPLSTAAEEQSARIEPTENQLLRITDRGVVPKSISLSRPGSLAFFFNDTSSSELSLEVDFGDRKAYCSTGRMKLGEDGIIRSKQPFGPRSFVTVCFPEKGEYVVRAFGWKGRKFPLITKVRVTDESGSG